jgi:hypothetical protein
MTSHNDIVTPAQGDTAIVVHLEHARGRHIRWLLIGGAMGGLCLANLGTLGRGVGVVLLVLAGWAGYQLIRTFLHPPGDIVVDNDQVRLPRGLCRGASAALARSTVSASYFLRRSVPLNRAAPVLVVEADGQAFLYPRDWFANEADQRRVLEALLGSPRP